MKLTSNFAIKKNPMEAVTQLLNNQHITEG